MDHPQPCDEKLCMIFSDKQTSTKRVLATDALPLPVGFTNKLFLCIFCATSYFLLARWSEKKKVDIPLHSLSLLEIIAVIAQISSIIYLWGFFGIVYVQAHIGKGDGERENIVDTALMARAMSYLSPSPPPSVSTPRTKIAINGQMLRENSDEDIAHAVATGKVPSSVLEEDLGDCSRAASVRKLAVEMMTGRSLESLPLVGFDYASVLGQCCEMVIGHIQIPVGVAGPLLLDGTEYMVPMATTEGCLVASTNRGCKAIYLLVIKSLCKASEYSVFLGWSDLYMRFKCSTGDAMGMNMVSKGVQNVLDTFSTCNYCSDKKAAAINWVQGRGKSIVCEVVIKQNIVQKVLKTSVPALIELNNLKNLTGSAVAGALGGFNAHASNIVSAIFLATGQDPAQNVESSHCITLMEPARNGRDLYISVRMPSVEVGTVGGGTQLASQAACLNMLGVKGANMESPGANAQRLAKIIAGAVLAGELSLMSALAAGHLVKSHMKYNRSTKNVTNPVHNSPKEQVQAV
ncbi:hypothetical protein KP509_30G015300 [Ceratopteris richardii]|uniref:hydroxymethylglutaryl-CoA reductase (NADPH) n=1 Tax=Ceratopteris richardii TaxID=49495 RepID=A0A8T2R1L7_CERRI|nr:hypothetical protein KP509_30G015300 [Ceratopteris richardii]